MKSLEQLPLPLLEWYRDNARTLPWRSDPTPYHVWISEIMLQQTRVAAVLDYYRRFLEELPTVQALAAVEEDRLLKLWQGLGYYNRARNLQKAARTIVEDFGGRFPDTYEAILSLPGIGEYTAGAIASIAFGRPVPAVDGNVLRVVARITGDRGDIARPETKSRMRAALLSILPQSMPGDFNQALMELGAKYGVKGISLEKPMAESLQEAKAMVDDIPIYTTIYQQCKGFDLKEEIEKGKIDCVAFTSSSTVEGFADVSKGADYSKIKAACIGKQTACTAQKYGLDCYVASKATIDDLITLIERIRTER